MTLVHASNNNFQVNIFIDCHNLNLDTFNDDYGKDTFNDDYGILVVDMLDDVTANNVILTLMDM